jgi:hypothetical protein
MLARPFGYKTCTQCSQPDGATPQLVYSTSSAVSWAKNQANAIAQTRRLSLAKHPSLARKWSITHVTWNNRRANDNEKMNLLRQDLQHFPSSWTGCKQSNGGHSTSHVTSPPCNIIRSCLNSKLTYLDTNWNFRVDYNCTRLISVQLPAGIKHKMHKLNFAMITGPKTGTLFKDSLLTGVKILQRLSE